MRRLLFLAALVCITPVGVKAQDAAIADPKHFKIEEENPQARVLRFTLEPHGTTVAHEHLTPHVEVQLTDSKEKEIFADGKEEVSQNKAGQVKLEGIVGKHTNQNIGDTPIETIIIELPPLCPPGERYCMKFWPPMCVPDKLCTVIRNQP